MKLNCDRLGLSVAINLKVCPHSWVPAPRMYPANFTPPSLATPSAAEHAQVLYRGADVTGVWPRAAAAQEGAMLTLRGWGFASGQHAGPGWACQILLATS